MTSTRALLIMTALLETVTGVALLTSPSAPVVTAMLVYNVAVVAVLAHASIGLSVTGALLWPAVGHGAGGVVQRLPPAGLPQRTELSAR